MRKLPAPRLLVAVVAASVGIACSPKGGGSDGDSGDGGAIGRGDGAAEGGNTSGGATDAGRETADSPVAEGDAASGRRDSEAPPGSDADTSADATAAIDGGSADAAASFRVFMIASTAATHMPMSNASVPVLQELGAANHFTVDSTTDTSLMNDANLSKYQVFLQMQLGSFEMPPAAQAAFEKFIADGKGWVGVHAAGLTGIQFIEDANGNIIPGYTYWPWYTDFFGGVTWSTHPNLQNGTLLIEDRSHPATRNLPGSFQLKDEWYEWAQNPRPNVHVLGRADESTYTSVHPMGDHPIVWSNEHEPRMIYIGVGHDPSSLDNPSYRILLRDAILWAGGR